MNGLLSRVFCLVCLLVLVCSVVCSSSLEVWAAESEIALIANPTETTETLNIEEMTALFVGSECTYFDGNNLSGTVKPIVLPTGSTVSDCVFVYLPIPGLSNSTLEELTCTFDLPITIKSCSYISTGVAPSSILYRDDTRLTTVTSSIDMQYILEDKKLNKICDLSFYGSIGSIGSNVPISDGLYLQRNNNAYGILFASGPFSNPSVSRNGVNLTCSSSDVECFVFNWNLNGSYTFTNYDYGIGFWIKCFDIHYFSGGGYTPGGSGSGGGGETDPGGGGTSPDYSAQLDKLYDELVKQGQIQQSQNAAIIQGQNDIIEGQKDILEAQKEQTEQDKQLWEDTFDPSEEDVGSLGDDIFSEDTQNELKEKLGLFTFLDDTFQQLLEVFDDSGGSTSLRFPGLQVTIDGTTYQVIEPYDFDIAETLDKFDFLIAAIRFVNGIIIVFAFLSYLHHLKVRFFGDD